MASTPLPFLDEKPYVPTKDRVRLTIAVTPEVHSAFQRMAAAGSMSVSRAMGDWLADSHEAIEFTTLLMEKARVAPKLAIRQMHAYANGLVDETDALMSRVMGQPTRPARTAATGAGARGVAGRAGSPPPCNTGGKVPRENPKRGARK